MTGSEKIGEILSSNLPKEFLLHVWESFPGALERATASARAAHEGHRSSVAGLMRHFNLNEALAASFEAVGIPHEAVRANRIMFGAVGIATVARVHLNKKGPWDNSTRSVGKRKLCVRNAPASRLLQPDFLQEQDPTITEITVLLVTVGGSDDGQATIYVVVTDDEMDLKSPLFREPIDVFLQRYERAVDVPDTAVPTLKPGVQINPAKSDEPSN
ncbi:MAG: hypothetical protein ACN6P1_17855 [Pseudomonas sp.]|uniref:hypothetical protein n=1 Tax=Pseudomonas sp. TaxID=306 RepID=UPI003D100021